MVPGAAAVLGLREARGAALSLALFGAEARELWTARFVGAVTSASQKSLTNMLSLVLFYRVSEL